MTFIDIHCHIDMCRGKAEDIVKRAKDAKVGIIFNNGAGGERNRKTLELASEFKEIKAALGFYPTDALKKSDREIDAEIDFILKNKDKISAIGEVGLDMKEDSDIEGQKKILSKFVNLSLELDVPLIVHSRKAERECIEFLEGLKIKKVIMHCFSGKFNLAKKIAENGWYLSIPANITFSEHFQKIAKDIPIENLFCETDSPFLHPVRGRFGNEPMNVVESYKKIAEIKKISLDECEKKIEENYRRLFKNI